MSRRALTDRDRAVLDFEREWTGQRGGKGRAITASFGISPARYYQLLAELVDLPDAAAHDPLLIHRLRRRRRVRLDRTAATGLADQRARGLTK